MSHHQLDPLWTQHLGHCCTRACFNRRNDMLGIGEPYGQMRSQHLFLMHDEQLQAKEEPARRPAHQGKPTVLSGDMERPQRASHTRHVATLAGLIIHRRDRATAGENHKTAPSHIPATLTQLSGPRWSKNYVRRKNSESARITTLDD